MYLTSQSRYLGGGLEGFYYALGDRVPGQSRIRAAVLVHQFSSRVRRWRGARRVRYYFSMPSTRTHACVLAILAAAEVADLTPTNQEVEVRALLHEQLREHIEALDALIPSEVAALNESSWHAGW